LQGGVRRYRAQVAFWIELRQALAIALRNTRAEKGMVWRHFWANQQRFFKLLAVSMKVPVVVNEVNASTGGVLRTRLAWMK
jgi:hypothetical protein